MPKQGKLTGELRDALQSVVDALDIVSDTLDNVVDDRDASSTLWIASSLSP